MGFMILLYGAAMIPAVFLLSLGAVLFLLTTITPTEPPGELVPVADLLTEEDL
jgi:hypothetical protein